MDRRLGFVCVVVEDRKKSNLAVNQILSDHGELIVGRMGVPYASKKCAVISLIVDATTDEVGDLAGKLGMVEGVMVKSTMSKK